MARLSFSTCACVTVTCAKRNRICGRRHTAQTAVPVFHVFVTGALPFASLTLCGQTMTSRRPRSDSSNPPDTPEAALATIHQLIHQENPYLGNQG